MNSVELESLAAVAIAEWEKHHSSGCQLYVENARVLCTKSVPIGESQNNPLWISTFEMHRGLTAQRWHSVGTALHNLYCKELVCQEHQKP